MCAAELFACVVFWLVAVAVIAWMLSAPLRGARRARRPRTTTEPRKATAAPPRPPCEQDGDDIKLGLDDPD